MCVVFLDCGDEGSAGELASIEGLWVMSVWCVMRMRVL